MPARALVAVLLLAPIALATAATGTSGAAQPAPWWRTTLEDADHDGLDDGLPRTDGPLTVLVDYATMPTPTEREALERVCIVTSAYANFPTLAARCASLQDARALVHLPGVVLVERNDIIFPLLKESVPLIGADQVWAKYHATGSGIVIAVLDDGAFEQHPDLKNKIAADYDAGGPQTPSSALTLPIGLVSPAGTDGHGTHVAGIALGPGFQSDGMYRGVAPDAQLVNVKVFSGPDKTTSDIVMRGLDWTVSHMQAYKIRVAVMSLGGSGSDGKDALSRAVDAAVDKGLVVVAAAGNAGPNAKTITSPGAAAKAITVGAVDKRKGTADFSSRGPTLDGRTKPDLVAPGVDITSTTPPATTSTVGLLLGGSGSTAVYYSALSGTSMATPHVAGVVALMLEANAALKPMDVKRILLVTAQDLGERGVDNETGSGFVNALAATQVAKDPTILDRPEFRARLDAVANAAPGTGIDRLSSAGTQVQQGPGALVLVLAALALIGAAAGAVILVRKKRRAP